MPSTSTNVDDVINAVARGLFKKSSKASASRAHREPAAADLGAVGVAAPAVAAAAAAPVTFVSKRGRVKRKRGDDDYWCVPSLSVSLYRLSTLERHCSLDERRYLVHHSRNGPICVRRR